MSIYSDLDNVTVEELFADNYEELGFGVPTEKPELCLYESLEGAVPFADGLTTFNQDMAIMPSAELNPSQANLPPSIKEETEAPLREIFPLETKPLPFFKKISLAAATCLTALLPIIPACSSSLLRKPNVVTLDPFSLSESILDKALPASRTFNAVHYEEYAETLLSAFEQGGRDKDLYLQTGNLLEQVLHKNFDIIPLVLKSGRVIESQFELKQTLSGAIGNANFSQQKEISDALMRQYKVREHLQGLIEHLKDSGHSQDKVVTYENRLNQKIQNTVEGFAPTISRGLNGTLFGPENHKREIIMVRNPDFTREIDYDPKNPSEHLHEKLYYKLANDHSYDKAPRGKYSIVEDPTIENIVGVLNTLGIEFQSLKNSGLAHLISKEIVLVMPTHGTVDKASGEHIFDLTDGSWPISNLYEHVNLLLQQHPEINSFKVLALNCRAIDNYGLNKKELTPNEKIETLYFNGNGYDNNSNKKKQGKVDPDTLSIFIDHLLNPPKTDEALIPTTNNRLQSYADFDFHFSGQGDHYYNHTIDNKVIEISKGKHTDVIYPDKSNEAEKLFEEEITKLIESMRF